METLIKFQAYIPKSLGKPLYDYFKNNPKLKGLENKESFIRELKSCDTKGYHWIPEPGNSMTDYYCSTDDIDYSPVRPFGHSVRLGFQLEIDINKIGEYYPMRSQDILKHDIFCNGDNQNQHSGFSHRVEAYIKGNRGYIKKYPPLKSEEKRLVSSVRSVRPYLSKDFDNVEINVSASAGYPYPNILNIPPPNIDFNLYFVIKKTFLGGEVSCSGWHNDFPAYELIVDDTRIYKYVPKAQGPGVFNLGVKTTHFNCSKSVSI